MIIVFNFFLFLTVSIKRIEKTKNRVKSELEVTIKATDSKHIEIFSAIESADSKRKKLEFIAKKVGSAAQHVGLKTREFQQTLAKQKRLREIWSSFDHRENDLLNQEIRIIRALDEFFFPLMITKQSFLPTLQKYPLKIIRSCLTSTFPNFWKGLIFRRYPFLPLQNSKNNRPLLQGVFAFF